MAADTMSIRLHLRRMRVIDVLVDEPDWLKVAIVDARSVTRCPTAGISPTGCTRPAGWRFVTSPPRSAYHAGLAPAPFQLRELR